MTDTQSKPKPNLTEVMLLCNQTTNPITCCTNNCNECLERGEMGITFIKSRTRSSDLDPSPCRYLGLPNRCALVRTTFYLQSSLALPSSYHPSQDSVLLSLMMLCLEKAPRLNTWPLVFLSEWVTSIRWETIIWTINSTQLYVWRTYTLIIILTITLRCHPSVGGVCKLWCESFMGLG